MYAYIGNHARFATAVGLQIQQRGLLGSPEEFWGGRGVVGMAGDSAGCDSWVCHLPRDLFSNEMACLLSKSPAKQEIQSYQS